MKVIAYIRPDDGEVFSVNKDKKTFSLEWLKIKYPKHLYVKYSGECLESHGFIKKYSKMDK